MRIVIIIVSILGVVACTKHNPNVCCTTEADCMAQGLPTGSTCSQGLLCRGNQCIAETCAGAADCDPAAPYCGAMQTCTEMCTDDHQCPGLGQPATATLCVSGGCAQCRASSDCGASAPVCDANACRKCKLDTECASQVCDVDAGTCVASSNILYASPSGSSIADCSQSTPCSVVHAVALVTVSRSTIRMLPGTYPSSLVFNGGTNVTIIGTGATLTGNGSSAAIDVFVANVTIRGMDVKVAADGNNGALSCSPASGVSSLTMRDLLVSAPISSRGLYASRCHVTLTRTTMYQYVQTNTGATLLSDRSKLPLLNLNSGSNVTATITNSTIQAISLPSSGPGPVNVHVSFSTFVGGQGFGCPSAAGLAYMFDNDIVLGDQNFSPDTIMGANTCFDHVLAYPQATPVGTNSIYLDPRFVDAANGNFHLSVGSPAIDAADPAATDNIDLDGTLRPQGAGRDIGAFEYKP